MVFFTVSLYDSFSGRSSVSSQPLNQITSVLVGTSCSKTGLGQVEDLKMLKQLPRRSQ